MLPWDPPTLLAPMEGVTHPELRAMMAERGGLGVVSTEFVRVSKAPLSVEALRREVVRAPGVPLSVQVMGNDPAKMAEAAGVVAEAGADAVDLNVGCPAPRVVRKGVGAALLSDLGLLSDLLGEMRRRVPVWLSAKIRAGWDDSSGALSIGRAVEASGADYLTVHPRRRSDFFEGVADWRIIRLLASNLRIPVVGNGDCWYAADALRMIAETGCAGVMIGRPALRNPWIFVQIDALRRGTTPFRPRGRDMVDHLAEAARRYHDRYAASRFGCIGPLKELVSYMGRAVNDGGAFKRAALRATSVEGVLEQADLHLSALPPEALDLDAHGSLGFERSGRCA